ncbi:conserved hypothetical protein [Ricinus communis]|uniref:Uncharacterized protein n=1 Tax=Ricinus communis TaxID=3988 RepID=B9T8G2_RICCO|nr:conserved hypothetical protein [Ricinus communis]
MVGNMVLSAMKLKFRTALMFEAAYPEILMIMIITQLHQCLKKLLRTRTGSTFTQYVLIYLIPQGQSLERI